MLTNITASLLALLGLLTFFSPLGRALNLASFTLVLVTIWKKNTVLVLLTLALLSFQVIFWGQTEGGQIRQQLATPLPKEYTTDMRGFLKTYQLMKSGADFYPAFVTGMAGLRAGSFHPDVSAWRQPFIFYFWKFLPGNGESIYHLWQLFIILDLLAAFFLAKKFLPPQLAILSPFILLPYFHFSLVDLTILQPEWWALSFFLWGLSSLLNEKPIAAGVFFSLSLATRELFVIPIVGLIVARKKFFWPLAIFAIYYFFYHLLNIFRFPTEIVRTGRHGGLYVLHSLFAYSSWSYFLGTWRPFLILLVLSFWRKKNILLATFLPLLLASILLATTGAIDETRDYWGIYFVPLLLVSAPILILPPGK